MGRFSGGLWTMLAILAVGAAPLAATELVASGGAFNLSSDKSEAEAGVGARFAPRAWGIAPEVGVAASGEGAYWVFVGVRRDFAVGSGVWALAPFWGVALYEEGSGRDLGGAVEFRSGFELSRPFGRGRRVGLAFYHLSNAGLYDINPGANSLVVTWAWRR